MQVITSSLPGEGKTTTSINLALAYAQMENTILVDCDLRKPAIAERFGYKKISSGCYQPPFDGGWNWNSVFVKDEKVRPNTVACWYVNTDTSRNTEFRDVCRAN
ncbi:hypothetical protein QW180_18885 [Vibrio sinaloensis]|nr:hypothetical protein [Vibrio sinaloensis]